MDIRDLHYFQVIAECGHMGKAAQRLFITQPALTKAVHRLEGEIGAPLLKRSGRGIALTDLGGLLWEKARYLREIMDDTTREIKSFAGGEIGHIRLGCAPTLAKYLLPGILRELGRQAPGVTVELESGMSDVLWDMLQEGRIDLALTHFSESKEGFQILPVLEDDVVVVAGRNHPIFSAEYSIHDLGRYGWVLPKASVHTRSWLDSVLEKHGCPPVRVQVRAAAILYLPRLIAETDLLSFISRRNLGSTEDGVLLREVLLPEATLRRVFSMAYRESKYLSPAVLRLITLLRLQACTKDSYPLRRTASTRER